MELCKRDGESMNHQGVLNEDRISELPEALILQILSLLPTKEAIATSVLSKQWQSLWKMQPNLKFKFIGYSRELEIFSKYVCKALLSHKALVLQSFQLNIISCNDISNAIHTRRLIRTALIRNVRNLELDIPRTGWFRFPKSLYNCETLETLKLRFIAFMEVPSSVCMKSLTTLHLYNTDFEDEESVINLLSGCPKLEDLMLKTLSKVIMTFTIVVPSLQRLTLCNYSGAGYVINAPCLKYLKIDLDRIGFCLIENVTKLEEANLIGWCLIEHVTKLVEPHRTSFSEKINKKLMESVASVTRLSLNIATYRTTKLFLTGTKIIFHQLVFLEIHTHEEAWRILLSLMLDTSPKLKVLKLIDTYGKREKPMCWDWKQPENVPECLLFHLERFMWKGYIWKREDHTEAAKYILSNASRLKRATFLSLSHTMGLKDRVEMKADLTSVVRASNSCELLFELVEDAFIYN